MVLALVSGLLIGGLITGCSISGDKADAESVATSVFEAVRNKTFDTAMTFYSYRFFEKTSEAEWLQILKTINVKLGDLQTYELTSWKVNKSTGVGTVQSGTMCEMVYDVAYSKYSATETLNIFKPATGGEFKILGHNINSIGLIKE